MILFYIFITIVNIVQYLINSNMGVVFWNQIAIIANMAIYYHFKINLKLLNRDIFGNIAIVYGFILVIYIVLGGLNYSLLSLKYPGIATYRFEDGNRYMVLCTTVYCLSSIILVGGKTNVHKPKFLYTVSLSEQIYFSIMIFGLLASIIGISRIGFVPILSQTYGDERYGGQMGSIIVRAWSYLVYPLLYYSFKMIRNRKLQANNAIYVGMCFIPLLMFNIRYYATLSIIALLFIISDYLPKKIKIKNILLLAIVVALAIQIPSFILNARGSGQVKYDLPVFRDRNMDRFVNLLVIDAFAGNYFQTIDLVTRFSSFRHGSTFWSVVVPLIPNPLLYAIGIDKRAVAVDNSSFILASMTEGTNSVGLRTGIMGELYVNFGGWGCMLMPVWAFVLSSVYKAFSKLHTDDFRVVFYYYLSAILIYSVIGQMNTIGSGIYNTILVGIVFYLFSSKHEQIFIDGK